MTAALTGHLVDRVRSSSPFVIKYIPYGRLSEVSFIPPVLRGRGMCQRF